MGCLGASDAIRKLLRVAGELLAKGEWRGVLRVRATDLDDVLEFVRLSA